MTVEMATKAQVRYLEDLEKPKPDEAKEIRDGHGVYKWGELTKDDAAKAIERLKGNQGSLKEAIEGKPKEAEEFKALETRDDEQILAELKGELIQEYVYSFPMGGREVVGLSYAGVKAIAQSRGNIKVSMPEIEDRGDFWLVKCLAEDTRWGLQMPGVSIQHKKMKIRGELVDDDFCLQKAVSKATRNAIRGVIPESVALKLVADFIKGKKGGA